MRDTEEPDAPTAAEPDPNEGVHPPEHNDPGQRLAVTLIIVGAAMLILALAGWEFARRGTSGVGGVPVANFQATAEADRQMAPDFTMPSLDGGGTIRLSSLRGQVVVFNFWASWCGPCRLEAPGLERVSEAYRDRGVHFLGIDYRDNRPAADAFIREFGITYPSVFDPTGSLADDYRLVGVPTTFVIDQNGRIGFRFLGYVNEQSLRSVLSQVLGGGR